MLARNVISRLFELGHFRNPQYPDGFSIKAQDVRKLTLRDKVVADAVASFQSIMILDLERISKEKYKEGASIDGIVGPATKELLSLKRCGFPDYRDTNAPGKAAIVAEAGATWLPSCAKAGISFRLNKTNMPSALRSVFDAQVLQPVISAYGQIGLKLVSASTGTPNIAISFRYLSGPTIGLAEFNDGTCGDSVFCYLDTDYSPNAATEASLLAHELGHNCNLEHTRGGIMNPVQYNVNTFDGWVPSDPSYTTLVRWFGGKPIPDEPPVIPPTDIEVSGTVQLTINGTVRQYKLTAV